MEEKTVKYVYSMEEIETSSKKDFKKVRDFNTLLASKKHHGRIKLVEPFRNSYSQHSFVEKDLCHDKILNRFKIEPYLLLHSLVTTKTLRGKKKELKLIKERFKALFNLDIDIINTSLYSGNPFLYTVFLFSYEDKVYRIIYEDESFFEKDYNGEIIPNKKYLVNDDMKLNYEKLNSPYYKQYLMTKMEEFITKEE